MRNMTYEIGGRGKHQSTEESEQSTEKREGHADEHCNHCIYYIQVRTKITNTTRFSGKLTIFLKGKG